MGYLNPPTVAVAAPVERAIPEAPAGPRFVASTVEEEILRLQEKNARRPTPPFDSEQPLMTRLTTEELEELLG